MCTERSGIRSGIWGKRERVGVSDGVKTGGGVIFRVDLYMDCRFYGWEREGKGVNGVL